MWEVKIDYERGKKVYIVCNGDERKGTFDDEDNAKEFADVLNSFD